MIVDSILNIFGVDLLLLPATMPELLLFLVRVVVGIGLIVWCLNLIKSWTIGIFGGKWLK